MVAELEDLEDIEEEKERPELKPMYIAVANASLKTHGVLPASCLMVISTTRGHFVLRSSSS